MTERRCCGISEKWWRAEEGSLASRETLALDLRNFLTTERPMRPVAPVTRMFFVERAWVMRWSIAEREEDSIAHRWGRIGIGDEDA